MTVQHTKPGSAMERVQKFYPKARCQKYTISARPDMKYAVKVSAKSNMILATGESAEIAWNKAAKLLCP